MWLKIFLFLSLLGALVAFGNGPFNDGSDLFTRRAFVSADSSSHDPKTAGLNETARIGVEKLLESINRTIHSKDILHRLFDPTFFFKTCNGSYNKDTVIEHLLTIPVEHPFNFTLQSVVDFGNYTKFIITATKFNSSPMEIVFILNRKDQQLISGRVICPKKNFIQLEKNNFASFFTPDEDYRVVDKFLVQVGNAVRSNDVSDYANFMEPNFIYKGCQTTCTKNEAIIFLATLKRRPEWGITINEVHSGNNVINFVVNAVGFLPDIVFVELNLSRSTLKLVNGKTYSCQNKNHFVGYVVPNPVYVSAKEDIQTIAMNFVSRMQRSIQSKDFAVIAGLFEPEFTFKGCNRSYKKSEIVQLLSQTPKRDTSALIFQSATDQGTSIHFTLSATDFSKNDMSVKFSLHKIHQKLEFGQTVNCKKDFLNFY